MTTFNMTCAAVRVTLPDYLDETLEVWVRKSIEEHLAECVDCATLARDLRNNAREAAALPALLPEHDVWTGIAGRIGAPIEVSAAAESAPPVATAEPAVLASDAFIPTAEPVVASAPPVPRSEPAVVAEAPPVPTSEPALVTLEESLPITEPEGVTSEPAVPLLAKRAPAATPVYEFPRRREKRRTPEWMGLAAAALVLVTAGTTFLVTRQWLGPARTRNVATDTGTRNLSTGEKRPAEGEARGQSAGSATPAPPPGLGSALMVSATSAPEVTRSPEDVVYDKEINKLQRIVRRQNAELDTSTVAVIEKNLRTLDAAIAQIRAALKKDPGSSLLDGQASRALEMKVELLRRAAMLRSNT
jgi:hypothetical protein